MSVDAITCSGCPCSPTGPGDTQVAGASRRSVLRASAGAVAGLAAVSTLAACGGDDATEGSGDATSAAAGGAALTALADVPVGGAVAVSDGKVIVAQPTAGNVVAFSSTCPHQGGLVTVGDAELVCTKHGSKFDKLTGDLASDNTGPATTGLTKVDVKVDGDNVVSA